MSAPSGDPPVGKPINSPARPRSTWRVGEKMDDFCLTVEVCGKCGAQLSRYGNGRCPVSRDHWNTGGLMVKVMPMPAGEQPDGPGWPSEWENQKVDAWRPLYASAGVEGVSGA